MQSTKSTSQKWPMPTNSNPYGRNRSDRSASRCRPSSKCRNRDGTHKDAAQPDGIDLLVPLVAEPSFDDVLGEDIAAQQKGVIGFERIKRLLQMPSSWSTTSQKSA